MPEHKIHIDTAKNIYKLDGKDFGSFCKSAVIKITPRKNPEVILRLACDVDLASETDGVQVLNDEKIDKAVDSSPATVETSQD